MSDFVSTHPNTSQRLRLAWSLMWCKWKLFLCRSCSGQGMLILPPISTLECDTSHTLETKKHTFSRYTGSYMKSGMIGMNNAWHVQCWICEKWYHNVHVKIELMCSVCLLWGAILGLTGGCAPMFGNGYIPYIPKLYQYLALCTIECKVLTNIVWVSMVYVCYVYRYSLSKMLVLMLSSLQCAKF